MFFFQAEDGIRDLVRSRGLGDVYKRQINILGLSLGIGITILIYLYVKNDFSYDNFHKNGDRIYQVCLLYTSDAADERSSVDLGGRRIIKKTKNKNTHTQQQMYIS